MGAIRFGVPQHLVLWLRDKLKADTFVETGTNKAETAVWAADHFRTVLTIEGQESLHAAALANHGHREKIQFLHGASQEVLGPVLDGLAKPAVLWLDAHWCGDGTFGSKAECPLMDEIQWVNQSHHDHAILIDDARLFLAPPPAPHRAEDWPGMLEVTAALSTPGRPRYAAVFEDVIVAVPASAKKDFIDYLRANAASTNHFTPAQAGWRRQLRRLLGR